MPRQPALEELIDHLDAVVWEARASPGLEFTFVSGAAERILGHSPRAFYDQPGFWAAHIHAEDRDQAVRYCEQAVARREHHTFEYRWLAGDDRVVYLRDVVRVHDGDPVLLRGVMLDVTRLRASEEQLRMLLDNAQDCVFRVRLGDAPAFEYVSPAAEALTGYTPEEFIADPFLALRIAEPEYRELVASTLAGEPAARETTSWRHRDGSIRWIETALRVVRESAGRPTAVEGVARDVTERVRAEQRSRRAQALFGAAFDQAPLGMGLTSLDPAHVDELVAVNDALCEMLGRSREELLTQRMDDVTHPEDRGRAVALKQRMLDGETASFYVEKRYLRPDGSVLWGGLHACLVHDDEGRPIHGLGQVEDISARRAVEAELSHRALHDGLTGLPNRQLFMDRLDHALAQRARDDGEHVAVLFVDVDDLKAINDSLGHSAGDAVIRQVGANLGAALRPGDSIARLAGDEFTVLCEGVPSGEAARQLAERLLLSLQEPMDAEGHRVAVRASVGVALARPGTGTAADALLGAADDALLRAKELGKQRVQLFDERMRERARLRRHSAVDLRAAVDRDELCLHYQPVIHLPSGAIWAVETLVRWRHPTRGLLPPADFIPLAERLGLIVDIGRWVVGQACRESAAWPRDHRGERLRVSVNLSSRELAEPDLTERLREIVAANGGELSRLTFEITETAIVDEPQAALRTMRELQGLGAHVAIDDFGKGHSSLAQLKTFPVDVLKLDRLFVRGIESSERDAALIDAVISMARALGLHLVVEGVEQRGQLDALTALGCQWGQGFHFARPMPAGELESLLASGRPATA